MGTRRLREGKESLKTMQLARKGSNLGLLEARGPGPSQQCPPLMFPPGSFLFLTLASLQMRSNVLMTVLKEQAGIDCE